MPMLDFKGKQFVYAHHLTVPFRQLVVDASKSVPAKGAKPGLEDNLIIHGDNLHALKALLPKYAGRIKCIYIDPPYNTGTEGWCYNDKVNSPLMQEWLKKEANPVDKEDLERHDKWLAMMWPRLQLLRELLADDGAIFISIDDNEASNLWPILDEIFGEMNRISDFTVIRAEGGGMAKQVIRGHDYLFVYAKDISKFTPLKRPKDIRGQIIEKDGEKFWIEEDWLRKEFGKYGTCHYEEINEIKGPKVKAEIDQGLKDGIYQLLKKKNGLHVVGRLRSVDDDSSKFYSVLKHLSAKGVHDLTELGLEDKFNYPKPMSLVMELIRGVAFSPKDPAIILDSFAGSGTTAHAVLALNKEDGGNRKFILVECEDYADKVTAERVRRVIKGVPGAKDAALKDGLGGSFTYCELGEDISIENLLKGNNLPSFDELAAYAFYTATGQTLAKVQHGADYLIGETDKYRVHLVYKPDLAFMRGNESALNMLLAKSIAKAREDSKKTALVFASQKFMGQKELTEMGIVFCQLPYALHRIVGA